ncbi:MAG: DUF971 domain-containing protein [Burkholderiaceae bacterium]|nr:DUF971 domain-containing protein [Burkholderiaceae bacterium]
MPNTPIPTEIKLRKQSRLLEVSFDNGKQFAFSFEFLRVYSPSAEVKGHGPGQETLQTGKREVLITALEPVGHYAIQPQFSDGHNSGIYSWDYLYRLGMEQEKLWREYGDKLEAAGYTRESGRDAPMQAAKGGCG